MPEAMATNAASHGRAAITAFSKPDRVGGSAPLDRPTRALVLLGGPLAALPLVAISSVLPQIATALARTPLDGLLIKQLIGGVGLAMVVGSALVGPLLRRVGVRATLAVAALAYAIAGTAGLCLSNLPALLVSRLALGVCAAIIQVTCMTIVNTRLDGVARARWMGFHISSAMTMSIAAHPVAGLLGSIGWRWPFALYALGLCLLPVALAQPAGGLCDAPRSGRGGGWRDVPWRFVALALALGALVYMPVVQVPFLLRQRGLANPAGIALVLTADALAGVAAALAFGAVRRHLSSRRAFLLSIAAAATGLALAATPSSIVVVVAGLLLYGAGAGWFVPNLMSALGASVAKAAQAQATGIVKAAHYLAAPLSVVLVEPVSRARGPAATLLAGSTAAFVGLAVFVALGAMRGVGARRADGGPAA